MEQLPPDIKAKLLCFDHSRPRDSELKIGLLWSYLGLMVRLMVWQL